MSMTAIMWSSSPSAFGLPSSPLNPRRSSVDASGSSSPVTSPTPLHTGPSSFNLHPPALRHRPISQPLLPRYNRPTAKRSPTTLTGNASPSDLFEGATSPVQNAMWNERFSRRVQDRERRKRARESDLQRRRSMDRSDEAVDEEEADRQAQADDEEIFRRLMVMQRKKADHARMVSYETETGGSDPMLPEFWEEDEEPAFAETAIFRDHEAMSQEDDEMMITPKKHTRRRAVDGLAILPSDSTPDEEDQWAREAAEAEQAERDAEEAEIARRVEEAYGLSVPTAQHAELDMDWDAFDGMDIE